jgi:hypothetical protein
MGKSDDRWYLRIIPSPLGGSWTRMVTKWGCLRMIIPSTSFFPFGLSLSCGQGVISLISRLRKKKIRVFFSLEWNRSASALFDGSGRKCHRVFIAFLFLTPHFLGLGRLCS